MKMWELSAVVSWSLVLLLSHSAVAHHLLIPDALAEADLVSADDLGMPFNETLQSLRRAVIVNIKPSSGFLQYIAYPLVTLAKYKVKTLRELLVLPFRVVMAPLTVARSVWESTEAIRQPFNVTELMKIQSALVKMSRNSTARTSLSPPT